MSVVMVERDKVGGTCLHRGCIPTKALLHAAEVADNAKEGPAKFGVKSTFDGIDMAGVNAYKDGVVSRLYKGLTGLVKIARASRSSRARAGSPARRPAGRRSHASRRATSCSPRARSRSRCPGSRSTTSGSSPATTRSSSDHVPGSVIVLGAGAIGCEFASVWNSFGADGHDRRGAAPPRPAGGGVLLQAARAPVPAQGHRVRRRRQADRCRRQRTTGSPSPSRTARRCRPSLLLVAVGRGPVSAGLGYEEAGVEIDRGLRQGRRDLPDQRPDHQRASATCVPGCSWHTSASARGSWSPSGSPACRSSRSTTTASRASPTPTRRSPRSGITSAVAKQRGHDVVTATYDFAGNGRAQILQTAGAVTLVAEKDGPVLGVHMVGERVGDLVAEAQLIVNWEAHAVRGRLADPPPPDAVRSRRRGPPRSRRQAAALARLAGHVRPPRQAGQPATNDRRSATTDAGLRHHAPPRGERLRRHGHPLAQAGGRARRGRRAAARGQHRQGRHRDPGAELAASSRRSRWARTRPSRSASSSP